MTNNDIAELQERVYALEKRMVLSEIQRLTLSDLLTTEQRAEFYRRYMEHCHLRGINPVTGANERTLCGANDVSH